jgi:TraM recognition site of TraD and TraG
VQEFRLAGRIANLAWKYCFQVATLRRTQPNDGTYLLPVFLWADEAQNFVTAFDAEYQAVARSASGCTVYLVQNRESLLRVLHSPSAVDSLLGNLQCKCFAQNSSPDSNEWASKLFGERWLSITGINTGSSTSDSEEAGRTTSSGVTSQEQQRKYVEPARFTTLSRGGAKHNFIVEVLIYNGGQLFTDPATGENLPYVLLPFNQQR